MLRFEVFDGAVRNWLAFIRFLCLIPEGLNANDVPGIVDRPQRPPACNCPSSTKRGAPSACPIRVPRRFEARPSLGPTRRQIRDRSRSFSGIPIPLGPITVAHLPSSTSLALIYYYLTGSFDISTQKLMSLSEWGVGTDHPRELPPSAGRSWCGRERKAYRVERGARPRRVLHSGERGRERCSRLSDGKSLSSSLYTGVPAG